MGENTDKGLVSIIMSVYNEEKGWIHSCLKSIINQSYNNLEIIVVLDNPKNELLLQILKEYQYKDNRIKLIINNNNIGLVASLNKALKNCNGKYIARMDADDICDEKRIEEQIKYLILNNLDLCASFYEKIDENDIRIGEFTTKYIYNEEIRIAQKYTNLLTHPSWLLKKEVIDELIEYNPIKTAEDYDFSCRVILSGYKIGIIPKKLLFYRERKNSITQSNYLYQYLIFDIVRKEFVKCKGDITRFNPDKKVKAIKVTNIEQENYFKAKEFLEKKIKKNKNKILKILYMVYSFYLSPLMWKIIIKNKIMRYKISQI